IHSDFDLAHMCQRHSIVLLQTVQGEVFQDDALTEDTPAKGAQFNCCARSLLDLLNDVLPYARIQSGPEVPDAQHGHHHKCDQQDAEYREDPPLSQKPQCCSFCVHRQATCQFRDFVALESSWFLFHPQLVQEVESD